MSGLQFPQDITQSGRYMTLRFSAYQRRTLNAPAVTQPISGDNTIRLPLPNDLVDSQRVQYGDRQLGPTVGAILENVVSRRTGPTPLPTLPNSAGDAAAAISELFSVQTLQGAAGGAVAGATGAALNRIQTQLPDVTAGLSQYYGVGINPFMTVAFEVPSFKTHRFSWKLVPRDQVESNSIKNIIATIKKAMLPGVKNHGVIQNNLLFEYPDIVEIFLTPNEYTYNFKRCVVESFNVNYAPGNSPAFYRGSNAPVAVDIILELKEIEYWTKADYGGTATQFSSLDSIRNLFGSQTPATPPVAPNPTNGRVSGPN